MSNRVNVRSVTYVMGEEIMVITGLSEIMYCANGVIKVSYRAMSDVS